jgi:L-fuculose-phosphate aldolase
MNTDLIAKTRAHITRLAAMLFERRLLDAAGGNLSARVGDGLICITPRYSGSKYQWQLAPEQVLVADLSGKILDGAGEISREAKVHLKLLNEFPDGGAVIHAHCQNVLVFCALAKPIPPVLEDTLKFGEIAMTEFAPAHTEQLAENIAGALRGQEARIRQQAAAAAAPYHGLFCIGKDLDAAFDAVERIDNNARCIILGQILKMTGVDMLAGERAALNAGIAAFKKA